MKRKSVRIDRASYDALLQDGLKVLSANAEIERLERELRRFQIELRLARGSADYWEEACENTFTRLKSSEDRKVRAEAEVERLKRELEATKPEPLMRFPINPATSVDTGAFAPVFFDPAPRCSSASVAATATIPVWDARQPSATRGNVADDFAAYMGAADIKRPVWNANGYRDAVRRLPGLGDEAEEEDDSE